MAANLVVQSAEFSIWMPVELERVGDIETIRLFGTPIDCQVYFSRGYGIYWMARYCEIPNATAVSASEAIDAAEAYLLEEARGKLVQVEDLPFQEGHARRLTADSALRAGVFDATYQALIVIARGRIYLLSTYGFEGAEEKDLQAMKPFIDSFMLIPNL